MFMTCSSGKVLKLRKKWLREMTFSYLVLPLKYTEKINKK